MSNDERLKRLTETFLGAWNSQNVEQVLACYTEDLVYRDPNTRGEVRGRDAMRRYLAKLFVGWKMHWAQREVRTLEGGAGAAFLWRASFERPPSAERVTIDGMDLVELRGDLVARNEVYFDRSGLAVFL